MSRSRGQAATEAVLVAAVLAVVGVALLGVVRASGPRPASARAPDGNAEAWCADFVSYVLRLAGRPFTGGQSGGWRLAAAAGVRAWFAARGRYLPRTLAQPLPGDVVYFRHSHVGIVVAVRGSSLLTIEGNASDAVRQRLYPAWRTIADIDGFGRP
jgi:hypothetical protein